ncbi:MAG: hypothetical protein KAS72_14035 [Phycisphaerales bacterium]|nr:hypothetical protein [Phycisphaerales bacterium]
MTLLVCQVGLHMLGQNRLTRISGGFKEMPESSSLLTLALVGLALLFVIPVAIAVGMHVVRRMRKPEHRAWVGMTRGLHIGFADRLLLLRLARVGGMSPAVGILVSRGAFETAAQAYLAGLRSRSSSGRRVAALRAKVFSSDEPASRTANSCAQAGKAT